MVPPEFRHRGEDVERARLHGATEDGYGEAKRMALAMRMEFVYDLVVLSVVPVCLHGGAQRLDRVACPRPFFTASFNAVCHGLLPALFRQ